MKIILLSVMILLIYSCFLKKTEPELSLKINNVIDSVLKKNSLNYNKSIIIRKSSVNISLTSSEKFNDENTPEEIMKYLTYLMLKDNLISDYDSIIYHVSCHDKRARIMQTLILKQKFQILFTYYNSIKELPVLLTYTIDSIPSIYIFNVNCDLENLYRRSNLSIYKTDFRKLIIDSAVDCAGDKNESEKTLKDLIEFYETYKTLDPKHLKHILNSCNKK
jgi:hypothetical protein